MNDNTLPAKQQAIIEAASDIFCDNGFARTRIEDIAKAANVGKGTVYEYFASKEQLLLSCCTSICDKMNEEIIDHVADPETAAQDPARALYHLMYQAIFTVVGSEKKHLRLFIALWTVVDKEPQAADDINRTIPEMYQQWESMCNDLYQLGVDNGSLHPLSYNKMPGHIITGVIDGWIWQRSFR
ncbi:MAG: TetR/AcrR family transcriptional regulator, partial [Planctomycetes bacterium]|nr:TetR/AcrR family transcriptional regulator [Planctomycetota bacterium]